MPLTSLPLGKGWILTLSCDDAPGIVANVSGVCAGLGANIVESSQFLDKASGHFFMRIVLDFALPLDREKIVQALEQTAVRFNLQWNLRDFADKPKILLMVSKFDHALLHLLYQIKVGWLHAEVVAIVSNHEQAGVVAAQEGIPFHYLPVTKAAKLSQEETLSALINDRKAELVVLARYMQILSEGLSSRLSGKVINIHHSFLPSFKGARPYHQAFERGVKLIGATAHYVTSDLDEGPIIEQETERVSHGFDPEDMIAVGRDIESRVLARAVKLHLERRVMLNGHRTVVFAA
jgi:formyltetrahydrofolate deformylase